LTVVGVATPEPDGNGMKTPWRSFARPTCITLGDVEKCGWGQPTCAGCSRGRRRLQPEV
jgi:hypothetical protein